MRWVKGTRAAAMRHATQRRRSPVTLVHACRLNQQEIANKGNVAFLGGVNHVHFRALNARQPPTALLQPTEGAGEWHAISSISSISSSSSSSIVAEARDSTGRSGSGARTQI